MRGAAKKYGKLIAGLALVAALSGCGYDEGDWLGPLERSIRATLRAWDMWNTAAVRPYESPAPARPEGTVQYGVSFTYADGVTGAAQIPAADRAGAAEQIYHRYCRHCHGDNGGGRIIVGESFDKIPTDLGSETVTTQSDRELYDAIKFGRGKMLALGETMTPTQIVLSIDHMRTLAGSPGVPFFRPQYTEPIKQ